MLTDLTSFMSVSSSYFVKLSGLGAKKSVCWVWGQADFFACWLDFLYSAIIHNTPRQSRVYLCITLFGWRHNKQPYGFHFYTCCKTATRFSEEGELVWMLNLHPLLKQPTASNISHNENQHLWNVGNSQVRDCTFLHELAPFVEQTKRFSKFLQIHSFGKC